LEELKQEFLSASYKRYQAIQVFNWLNKGIPDFDEMTDISKELRGEFKLKYTIPDAVIEEKLVSKIDGTVKYLLKLYDGEFIESVLMKYHHGYSICISTQVGCKMGCKFCATGKGGFSRNLYPSEMISQIHTAQKDNNIRISNVVLMGIGEPLDNYDNTVKFLKLISSHQGLNIGMRHISVSTCGVVDKIYKLADEKLQVTLSVSLHETNDDRRSQIMPINNKWKIEEIIKACNYYFLKTNRRVSFEYTLIKNVNDSSEHAKNLIKLLRGMNCYINIIPINSIEGGIYGECTKAEVINFCNILINAGITATIRRTLGSDINASCGQLKARNVKTFLGRNNKIESIRQN
jgi:23S rRNA (adenine2503-C2)-methyltransferase